MAKYVVTGHYVAGYLVEVEARDKEEALLKGIERLEAGEHDTTTYGDWQNSFEAREK